MASRLVYGMARQRVVPSLFGTVHSTRGTPWVAILFTTAIAVVLAATGDIGGLAETTVLLLLCVFALVNISVLVLRRDRVDHEHFRAPTWMPVLGALVCLILALPITGRDTSVYVRVGVLIAIGVVLWFVNRLCIGRVSEIDASQIVRDR
jgi:amino acid transporter